MIKENNCYKTIEDLMQLIWQMRRICKIFWQRGIQFSCFNDTNSVFGQFVLRNVNLSTLNTHACERSVCENACLKHIIYKSSPKANNVEAIAPKAPCCTRLISPEDITNPCSPTPDNSDTADEVNADTPRRAKSRRDTALFLFLAFCSRRWRPII